MPLVLDVRDRKNYEAGHAIDAYNIPFDELHDRGFEMPAHKTPLVVECDAADVEAVRDWFATRDERCRWNVVDVRAAGAEATGPGVPGRFLFTGSPLLAAMEQHVRAVAAAHVETKKKAPPKPPAKKKAAPKPKVVHDDDYDDGYDDRYDGYDY